MAWSKKHDCCTECDTTAVKHHSKGLCYRCYKRIQQHKPKYAKRRKERYKDAVKKDPDFNKKVRKRTLELHPDYDQVVYLRRMEKDPDYSKKYWANRRLLDPEYGVAWSKEWRARNPNADKIRWIHIISDPERHEKRKAMLRRWRSKCRSAQTFFIINKLINGGILNDEESSNGKRDHDKDQVVA